MYLVPLPSLRSWCFGQPTRCLWASSLHLGNGIDGFAGSPVGRKAGTPILGGWVMVSHRLHPVFPGEVLLTLCVWLHTHACQGGCPVLGYPLSKPPCPYLNCASLGKKAVVPPRMGIPGLSFALLCTHGPLSGTRWNPQLDLSLALCGTACSCLFSHGAVQLPVLYTLRLSLNQGALRETFYPYLLGPTAGVDWLLQGCLRPCCYLDW